MSPATMKIPEPIIDPTTIIVPSNNPMARTKPASLFTADSWMVAVVSAIRGSLGAQPSGRLAQQLHVLMSAARRIRGAENVAHHRNAICAGGNHLSRSLHRNAPNCHDRLIRQTPNLANGLKPNNGIGIDFGAGLKNGS